MGEIRLIVFTMKNCPFCEKYKQYLKLNKIDFKEIDFIGAWGESEAVWREEILHAFVVANDSGLKTNELPWVWDREDKKAFRPDFSTLGTDETKESPQ